MSSPFVFILSAIALLAAGCSQPGQDNFAFELDNKSDSIVTHNLILQSQHAFQKNKDQSALIDQSLLDAESLAIKSGNLLQLCEIYQIKGRRYRDHSHYIQALEYHKKALEIAQQLHHPALLAESHNLIGVIYRRINENSKALEMHLQGLQFAEEAKDTFNLSVSLNGIGNINLSLSRYDAANEYFKKSLKISQLQKNKLGQAINYNNIGEVNLAAGFPDSALVYFFKSLEYNIQINQKAGQAICYNSIGDSYIAKGDPEQALVYLMKGLPLNRETGDRINVAKCLNKIGESYLLTRNYEKAGYFLTEGLSLSKNIGTRHLAQEACEHLSEMHAKKNQWKEALDYYRLATVYKDSVINDKNLQHISTLEAVYELGKQKSQIEELNRQNELQHSKLSQQKMMIISVSCVTILVLFILFLIVRQSQLKEKFRTLNHKQRLLRSQMNPHFIFNALSAIQVFILENDMEKSSRFLSDFAKLMRMVLKNSNYDYITLKEELDIIGYYVELQKLRFFPPFEFELIIDAHIDQSDVMVPPMLAQPFLENAIEHGLLPVGGDGRLVVSIFKESGFLTIEVDDNGIGFSESGKHRQTDKNHESFALKIIKERLEIIRRDSGKEVHFSITDKKEMNPFGSGTLVKISIPVIEKSKQKM